MLEIPETIKNYYRRMLLGDPYIVRDEQGKFKTIYVLPEDLNGDNKGQDDGKNR